jgi:hypothetical protein
VLVDVRVRVTPYRAVGDRTPDERAPDPDVPGVPAAAPAPIGRGWHGCASYWVRLIVPVVREEGRLVVDAATRPCSDTDTEPTGPGAADGTEGRPSGAADRRGTGRSRRVPDLEPEGRGDCHASTGGGRGRRRGRHHTTVAAGLRGHDMAG